MGDGINLEDIAVPSGPRCASISGVSVHANVCIQAHERMRLERLCHYAGRAPVAIERLSLLPDGRLLYRLKRYGNKARGQRRKRKQNATGITPGNASGLEPETNDFRCHCRHAWARLVRKVWAADPLACPKCGSRLRIIVFIDNPSVIEKILHHLKLWDTPERPPPRSTTLQ